MNRFFRVIAPSNSSFYDKIGQVVNGEGYEKSNGNYGLRYKLNFAFDKKRCGAADIAWFYDHQLIEVDANKKKNNEILGSQERLI